MEQKEMEQKRMGTTLYSSARRGDRADVFFGSLTCANCGAEVTEAARSCDNCGMPAPEEAAPREAPIPQESVVPPDRSSPPLPSHPPMQQSALDLGSLREEASPQQEEDEVPPALREVVSAQGIGGPSGASRTFSVAQPKRALLLASVVVALLVLASGGAVALAAGVGSVGGLLEGSEPPQPVDEAQPSDSQEEGAASGEDAEEASYSVYGDALVSSPSPGGTTPSEEVAPSVPSFSGPTLSEEVAPSALPEWGFTRPAIGWQEAKAKADPKSSPVPAPEDGDPEEHKTPAGSWAEEAATKKAPPAATKGP